MTQQFGKFLQNTPLVTLAWLICSMSISHAQEANRAQDAQPKYNLEQAAQTIHQKYGGEVVGASEHHGRANCPYFSIRLLSAQGRVKTHVVDSCSGQEIR